MRSYYTYGAIPDPVRTVQGFDDGGLASALEASPYMPVDESAGPSQEYNPVTALPRTMASPTDASQSPQALAQAIFDKYTSQASSGVEKKLIEQGLQGIFSYDMSRAMQGYAPNQDYDSRFQSAADSAERTASVLAQVKPYLDSGDYKSAFKIAEDSGKKDYEQNLADASNVSSSDMSSSDLVKNKYAYSLLSPDILKEVTGPMSSEQIKDFYKAVPLDKLPVEEIAGTKSRYTDEGANKNISDLAGGSGYPDPLKYSVVEKGTNVLKESLAPLAYVAASGLLITGLGSALSSLGAGAGATGTAAGTAGAAAGTGGGGALSAIKGAYQAVAGIPGTIGRTVAQTLGLPINSAVAQTAFGNSIISGATTAAKGGDIGDIIKSGLIAAGVTYGVDTAVNAVKGMMPQITKTVGQQVADTAAATGVPTSTALDALQEVVVTGKRVADVAGLAGAATGALSGTRGVTQPSTEDLQEVEVTGKRFPGVEEPVGALTGATTTPTGGTEPTGATEPKEPTVEDLEEVEVTGKRVPTTPPVVVTPPTTPTKTEPTGGLEDLEEVEVKSKRPGPLTPPVVVTPPVTPPVEPPGNLTPEDLEEVEVKSRRPGPLTPPVVTTPPLTKTVTPPKTIEDLEEVEVTSKRPPKIIAPPVIVTPPLTPPPDPKDILKDYKPTKIEDPNDPLNMLKDPKVLAKLLGLLGGAGAAAGSETGGGGLTGKFDTTGGASFGAALQPVQFGRKQLSPDIDYYTYATRPEAKFFEYNTQLAQPTQPPGPTTSPPVEPSGVITEAAGGYIDDNMTGGLVGYAKGGQHTPEDYVEGPGSGREDLIPAMLSDGEYVIDAETLALLGDGSTKEGARRMDQFRANIRKHKGRALSRGRISPNAKSPDKYMGGGLT